MGKQYMIKPSTADRLDGIFEGKSASEKLELLIDLNEQVSENGNWHIVQELDQLKLIYGRLTMVIDAVKIILIMANNRMNKAQNEHELLPEVDEMMSRLIYDFIAKFKEEGTSSSILKRSDLPDR